MLAGKKIEPWRRVHWKVEIDAQSAVSAEKVDSDSDSDSSSSLDLADSVDSDLGSVDSDLKKV